MGFLKDLKKVISPEYSEYSDELFGIYLDIYEDYSNPSFVSLSEMRLHLKIYLKENPFPMSAENLIKTKKKSMLEIRKWIASKVDIYGDLEIEELEKQVDLGIRSSRGPIKDKINDTIISMAESVAIYELRDELGLDRGEY